MSQPRKNPVVSLTLPSPLLEQLDQYAERHTGGNRSKAASELIEMGLDPLTGQLPGIISSFIRDFPTVLNETMEKLPGMLTKLEATCDLSGVVFPLVSVDDVCDLSKTDAELVASAPHARIERTLGQDPAGKRILFAMVPDVNRFELKALIDYLGVLALRWQREGQLEGARDIFEVVNG